MKLNGFKGVITSVLLVLTSVSARSFDFYETTRKLMDDLNSGDSTAFMNHFLPEAILYHIGDEGLEQMALKDFNPVLAKFRKGEYRENFSRIDVLELPTGLTHVDVHFDFYISEKLAFSGIDHVIWVKTKDGYKISNLYSGSLKPKFTTSSGVNTLTGELDQLMLKWHNDVAIFSLEDYFSFMSDEFIFLGTDPKERWTKEEFKTFCVPYFEKKSTWNFKTNWRNWYINERNDVAWFEESLDTQMEECRGSGVLIKENGAWKIAHYNLAVVIENEKMKQFIKLRKK